MCDKCGQKPSNIELLLMIGHDTGHKVIPFIAKSDIDGPGLNVSIEGHNIEFVESYLKCCLEALAVIKGEDITEAGSLHRILM